MSTTPQLQFLFVDEPFFDEHDQTYTVAIRSKHDQHLVAEETHKFRGQAIENALAAALRIEAAIDTRPSLSREVAS